MDSVATTASRADDLKRFFLFRGRATRTEWWLVHLAEMVAVMLLVWLCKINLLVTPGNSALLINAAFLGLLWVKLAVDVRRLHDMDRSGWWVALALILNGLGQLAAIVWLGFFNGTPGENRFGPNPRGMQAVMP